MIFIPKVKLLATLYRMGLGGVIDFAINSYRRIGHR